MKCQKCKNNEATTHVKRVINGVTEEYELCRDCAEAMGVGNIFRDFSNDFGSTMLGGFNSLFKSLFENALPARTQATRCETCGSSYNDIMRTGMMGCADCYSLFRDEIMPTVRRVHGNTVHCGKNSPTYKVEIRERAERENEEKPEEKQLSELDSLKVQLDEAVKNQEFEKAAELRDRIKAMEAQDE